MLILSRVARSCMADHTWAAFQPGFDSRISAATPATCGDAIDVPLQDCVPPPMIVEVIPDPGAKMSVQVP